MRQYFILNRVIGAFGLGTFMLPFGDEKSISTLGEKSIIKLSLVVLLNVSLSLTILRAQEPGSGYTLQFDGIDDKVKLNSSFGNLSLPASVSCWIKLDNTNTYRIFYSHDVPSLYHGFWFQCINNKLMINFGDGTGKSPASRSGGHSFLSLQPNRWYHIAGVLRSSTDVSIYLNGNPLPVSYGGTGGATMFTKASSGMIGNYQTSYFDGKLDELSVWDIALTTAQVRDLMCKKLTGNENGLLAYYKFDKGNGNNLVNSVTGAPNGTLRNGPAWHVSGAALGNKSSYKYQSVTSYDHILSDGMRIRVENVSPPASGIQVYEVPQKPKSLRNLPNSVKSYWGIFIASSDPTANITYNLRILNRSSLKVYGREANDEANWISLTGSNLGSDYIIYGETNRGEYVIEDGCPDLLVQLGKDTAICEGQSVALSALNPNANYSYSWNTGANGASTTVGEPGVYWVEADSSGCNGYDTLQVHGITGENFTIEADTAFCISEVQKILKLQYPGYSFLWPDGSRGNSFQVPKPGLLEVRAISPCDTSIQKIRVIFNDCDCQVFAPNAFTPNGDGLNEKFDIKAACELRSFQVSIYNRWGNLVFHSRSLDHDWDGTFKGREVPQGVYYYQIRYSGATTSGSDAGPLTLIR